jgi:hypothetical protein
MVVIANLYGEGDLLNDKARQEYREIKMNVLVQRQEGERSYSDMFRRYRKRVLIAMSAQALAQLNGINVISYYAPLVFESVRKPHAASDLEILTSRPLLSLLKQCSNCHRLMLTNLEYRPVGLDGMPSL